MPKNKLVVPLAGLHCRSCEILIEDGLSHIPGVIKSKVSHKLGTAEIFYHREVPDIKTITENIESLGYKVGLEKKSKKNAASLLLVALVIIAFGLITYFNLLNVNLDWLQNELSWPLAIVVGLVAGVSTCMALVGGLVLAISSSYAQKHPEAKATQKFIPHLIFNSGRILGFFILGGLLGLLGSSFKLSSVASGLIAVIIGLFIMFLGLKLLGFFSNYDLTLPKGLSRALKIKSDAGQKYKTPRTMILGALTFFLPCGFTQAMQVYALSSGDFWTGGLIMAAFALGTMPGLLGLGGLASIIKGRRAQTFYKIVGAVLVIFALLNLTNGYKLLSVNAGSLNQAAPALSLDPNVEIVEGVQVIRMTESSRGYSPNQFTIQKGIPVKFVIDAKAPYSCASALIIPSLNIDRQLVAGENIIEFTPEKSGNIPFSCSMGMYTGNFRVVDGSQADESSLGTQAALADEVSPTPPSSASCGGGAGTCSCGVKPSNNVITSGTNTAPASGTPACH